MQRGIGHDVDDLPMQKNSYASEELVAEMIACFVCGHCGIETQTIDNTSAYIASWLKRLGSDPKLVLGAGSKAQKGANWILDIPDPYAKTETETELTPATVWPTDGAGPETGLP